MIKDIFYIISCRNIKRSVPGVKIRETTNMCFLNVEPLKNTRSHFPVEIPIPFINSNTPFLAFYKNWRVNYPDLVCRICTKCNLNCKCKKLR